MMPWLRMLSASSYSEPSSMRVRGWYLPACICVTFSAEGSVGPPAGAGVSSIFGPSRASRPMPSPLGFFVTMWLIVREKPGALLADGPIAQQIRQQLPPFGPVAQAGVAVQVAARADFPHLRAPVG